MSELSDVYGRRHKEWVNYQKSHRSAEDRKAVRAFIDISVNDALWGRLVFELFNDEVPLTVNQFMRIITGSMTVQESNNKEVVVDYINCPMYYIDNKLKLLCFGNLENEKLTLPIIREERFCRKHASRALLTMISHGPCTTCSSFAITLAESKYVDYKQVVVGKVIEGHELLAKLEKLPVDNAGRLIDKVRISFCGILSGQIWGS